MAFLDFKICFLILLLYYRLGYAWVRDGSLEGLAELLNTHGPKMLEGASVFSANKHGAEFLSILGEWLGAEPAVSLRSGDDGV